MAWLLPVALRAQNIPENLQYTQIYSFLDELAGDGLIHLNSAVRPYPRNFIAQKLLEAQQQDSLLSRRQRDELGFYLNEFSLERDTVPDNWVEWTNRKTFNLSLAQPSFHYLTPKRNFKISIKPILGMDVYASKKGAIIKRWYGAEINMDIARHVSIWGSLRDNSWNGLGLKSEYYPSTAYYSPYSKQGGAKLSRPGYLNDFPAAQYKEAERYGADFSDSKGGISLYSWWGSISLQRESIVWGDAYHSSVILSGHNPAVPMLSINLRPCRWFEFNWFHAWLVSNVLDSTYYYTEVRNEGAPEVRHYRPAGKYMSANMFTFSPIRQLSFSIGNSIVYAERTPQAIYFIPVAFYKSLDHLLTKGLAIENQNSQVFFTINTRNLRHLNLYASVFVDEFSLARWKPSNPQRNLVSWQVGFNLTNWPLRNLSLQAEFMRSNIACYTHSVALTAYTSNSYNMGHYMGDNAQNIYAKLSYKPVRGLYLAFSYTNDTKYRNFNYVRKEISNLISQKPFADRTWQNDTFAFDALYEVFSGCYATVCFAYNHARGFAPSSERIAGEDRGGFDAAGQPVVLQGAELEQYYLDKFSPVWLQGRNFTFKCGLTFNF